MVTLVARMSTCFLLLAMGTAQAESTAVDELPAEQVGEANPPQAVQPSAAAPTQAPPAPPAQLPPVPIQQDQPAQVAQPMSAAPGTPGGQWVYTEQYGWLFMPYGDRYVYEGTSYDEYPYAYVYYPSYGWSW